MTLARYFLKLCSDAEMTNMHEIARRAKIDPSTPWKIKEGRPVRASTLGKVLTALGYTPKDLEYRQAFALWGAEVVGDAHGAAMNAGAATIGARGTAAERIVARFTEALRSIPRSEWPLLDRALSQPESLVLWLRSTEALKR